MATQPKKATAKKTATKRTPARRDDRPAEPEPQTAPDGPTSHELDPHAVLEGFHTRVARAVGAEMADIILEAAKMEALLNGKVIR